MSKHLGTKVIIVKKSTVISSPVTLKVGSRLKINNETLTCCDYPTDVSILHQSDSSRQRLPLHQGKHEVLRLSHPLTLKMESRSTRAGILMDGWTE